MSGFIYKRWRAHRSGACSLREFPVEESDMSDQPTIVLVHGFWGGAAHWNRVIVELLERGYQKIRAVELPLTSWPRTSSVRASWWPSRPGRCCWWGIPMAVQ